MKSRKVRYKGKPSEILESIEFDGFEIRSLKHGNTNHVLYRYPRLEDGEACWGMDLETAKKGVQKWKTIQDNSGVESNP
jgi:hypothetical protein